MRYSPDGSTRASSFPIEFECENGECGSCPVKVSILANKQPMGMHLTEKEKTVLRLAGKITRQQIEEAEAKDIPPRGAWLASSSSATRTSGAVPVSPFTFSHKERAGEREPPLSPASYRSRFQQPCPPSASLAETSFLGGMVRDQVGSGIGQKQASGRVFEL